MGRYVRKIGGHNEKKQLFAILLAGAMTAGTVPSAALAAENDIPAASSEVTEGENSGEIPQEEGGEPTPEAEPTQTPETAPEAPTETPAEPTETPTVPETPAEPTQVPETETTPEAVPSEAPETLENEPTGISITTIDENNQETVTYYKTLQEAVDAAPTIESGAQESTVIEITDSLALSGTISVSGKRSALWLLLRESPFAESRRKTEQYLTEQCSPLPDRAASFSFL